MTRTASILAFLLAATSSALAQSGPQVVIPNRSDVPIIINGVDASFAVVEGDWGLARSIHVQPTVYGGRPVEPLYVGRYFPSAGSSPGYGRLEIEPPPRRRASTHYHRSWNAQSEPPREPPPSSPLMIQASPNGPSQDLYDRSAPRRRGY